MTDWIDRHSVTCLICGGLADERRTVDVREWDLSAHKADAWEGPKEFVMKQRLLDIFGNGEAHRSCFDHVMENHPDPSEHDLDPKVGRD